MREKVNADRDRRETRNKAPPMELGTAAGRGRETANRSGTIAMARGGRGGGSVGRGRGRGGYGGSGF